MWMPQQQDKQQHQQPANMVPVNDVGLNSNYPQEWQSQFHPNYGQYQSQPGGRQQQSSYQNSSFNNQSNQQQSSWQTQPLQVPTPLPPQYAQQVPQQLPSNVNNLQKQHQLPLKQQLHQQPTPQTSSYFPQQPQQPFQIPMFSTQQMPSLKTEPNSITSGQTSTDSMNNFSNNIAANIEQPPQQQQQRRSSENFGSSFVEQQQQSQQKHTETVENNNAPKLQNFFEKPSAKKDTGDAVVDGWDDWDWHDLNASKDQTTDMSGVEKQFSNITLQPYDNNFNPQSTGQQQLISKAEQLSQATSDQNQIRRFSTEVIDKNQESKPVQQKLPLRDVVNDNWKWGSDEVKTNLKSENVESKSAEPSNIEDGFSYQQQSQLSIKTDNKLSMQQQQSQLNFDQQQIYHQYQQQPQQYQQQMPQHEDQQYDGKSKNVDSNQTVLGNNPVYITQAKPVSQPSKQFASPPETQFQHPDISKIPPPMPSSEETNSQEEQNLENKAMQLPPPPITMQAQGTANPFKRTGPVQHGKAGAMMASPFKSTLPPPSPMQQPFGNPQFFSPPPPEEFRNQSKLIGAQENQEIVSPENSEIINDINEINEDTSDRNRYMQISHLSEEGSEYSGSSHNQHQFQNRSRKHTTETDDQINENDAFPPPGLSRLVLGQPETESLPTIQSNVQTFSQSNYIPPKFDRMVPGTELASSSNINLQRQADGQDTMPSPNTAFQNVQPVSVVDIDDDLSSDRNLYQVPGKSENSDNQPLPLQQPQLQQQPSNILQPIASSGGKNHISTSPGQNQVERVVTGLEDISTQNINTNQREVDVEGENLEDNQNLYYQNQQHQLSLDKNIGSIPCTEIEMPSPREERIEGANTPDLVTQSAQNKSNEHDTNSAAVHVEKQFTSIPSTANDESDERREKAKGIRRNSRHLEDRRSKRSSDAEGNIDYDESIEENNDRYLSESEDNTSDNQDKRQQYRKNNVKNNRNEKYNRSNRLQGDRKEKSSSSSKYRESGRDSSYRNKNERSDEARNEVDGNRSLRRDRRDQRDRDRERLDRSDRDFKERKGDRDRDRDRERDRNQKHRRYENESRYETEGSRYRNDSDQENYAFGSSGAYRRDDKDRRYKKRDEKYERNEYDLNESRRRDRRRGDDRNDYKYENRKDKHRRNKKDKSSRSDYDDEYHKGSSSRNASERERDQRERSSRDKDRYSQMYGYPNVYGYDPYTYYQQQQQYYEQLRRTNPQAYAEWYNKYFVENAGHQMHPDMLVAGAIGAVGAMTASGAGGSVEGRDSVHSGRSSVNNDKDRIDNMSLTIGDSISLTQDINRMTPLKFSNEHSIATLSAGVMVCVKPKYMHKNGSRTVKIFKIGCNDATRRLFQSFPGPLVRGITHKKTIIEFCEDQIRLGPITCNKLNSRQNSLSSLNSINQSNKASFVLMWNLLILLLRQNGVVIGTDIAELLIRNQKDYPYIDDSQVSSRKEHGRIRKRPSDNEDKIEDGSSKSDESSNSENEDNFDNEDVVENYKRTQIRQNHLNEDEITDKFRNYLLYGNINEALEWATNNNLWGHALFLASKVDRRLYANVMMKFANKLPLNDPLQTLYQLMSYKTPASVTCVQDEKWGDWRPHLAMILSNTSQRPDLDRKAITTLGDSLYNRGDHFGAHFCFLMAQVGFGTYSAAAKQHENSSMLNSQNAIRLVLLGSPFNKNFKEFSHNEAIMMTEIYEYACSLNDDKFSIPEFQPYKFLLATRMLDYGFQMKSLMYLEQIALHIQLDPSKYDFSFIAKVFNLSDRLKFYDPTIEKTLDNLDPNDPKFTEVIDQFENQKWLQSLQNMLGNYKPETVQSSRQGSYDGNSTYSNYDINSINSSLQNQSTNLYDTQQPTDNITEQFRAINQQFYELNSQYNDMSGYSLDSSMPNNQSIQQTGSVSQQQIEEKELHGANTMAYSGADYQQPGSPQFYDPIALQQSQENNGAPMIKNDNLQNVQYQQQTPHSNQNLNVPYNVQEGQNQMTSDQSIQQQQQPYNNNQNAYDYSWNQTTVDQGIAEEVARPSITLPNAKQTSQNKSGFYDDGDSGAPKNIEQNKVDTGNFKNQRVTDKKDIKTQNKSTGGSSQNSGWFEGIWNKLSLKPKNQMILPDDKNPTIVWDPEKKRWINTDGDENESESFKPPPKMSEIKPTIPTPANNVFNQQQQQNQQQFQQQQQQSYNINTYNTNIQSYEEQQQQQQPQQQLTAIENTTGNATTVDENITGVDTNNSITANQIGEATKVPHLQSNMFKMQRNRTLKKSYVDVFNPSGAPSPKPAEPILAPVIPTAVPQTGFFIPAATDNSNNQQQQQEGAPQFYNPNQFAGYQQPQ